MAGDTGIMRCTIPQGRKDGKKAKGSAFDRIVGVGDHPGEEYAALNVLHQVERGKPLERLLAPEFRGVWLDLDKRFVEVQEEQRQREESKERRQKQAERRERHERSKESATINISAASRQMIEDALSEHQSSGNAVASSSRSVPANAHSKRQKNAKIIQQELQDMGFAQWDALDASQRFSTSTDALDYLCLNLDEAELPPSFAPTADIEVVHFSSGPGKQGPGRIDPRSRDFLTSMFCFSNQAAERALRRANGEVHLAMSLLYNVLTHNILADDFFHSRDEEISDIANDERRIEEESIRAIYGDDAVIGVTTIPELEGKWATVVCLREGLPLMGSKQPVHVAFIDLNGSYPVSPPLVIVGYKSVSSTGNRALSAALRRVLMRAIAGEITSLRASREGEEGNSIPVPVIHMVLSFLADVTENDLKSSATTREAKNLGSIQPAPVTIAEEVVRSDMPSPAFANTTVTGEPLKRRFGRPLPVEAPRRSKELSAMLSRRSELPAHRSRAQILKAIRGSQVVVVSGATGSGKTTQVPQFLLEDAAISGEPISIVCTQPRRIAAMSVAERVAAERCQKLGDCVGYQVKLNTKKSRNTRLLFCTTGVLLRRLQDDPLLENLTHVLVDEVHERSVETDFLLLLLREISVKRQSLRIVLMSATLDAKKFSEYFGSVLPASSKKICVPVISVPGRTFPVNEYYLGDAVHLAQYRLKPGDKYAKRVGRSAHKGKYGMEPPKDAVWPNDHNSATAAARRDVALDDIRHKQEAEDTKRLENWDDDDEDLQNPYLPPPTEVGGPLSEESKQTVSLIDEAVVNADLIAKLVKRIDTEGRRRQEEGAILIFLPGLAEIAEVIRKLSSGPGSHGLWLLPLHSMLSSDDQGRVFSKPPKGKRKVICSTNIAETSITVDDVTVVIDTLRAKEMTYDPLNRASVLEECFISKAAAKQRAGRAGRVSKGTCYRLVRQHTFENRIVAQGAPEIQRVALEQLVLHMLSIIPEEQSKNDPHMFLGKAVDPPQAESITTAVTSLIDIGALRYRDDGQGVSSRLVELTALGRHLTGMPVDARIGKLLIFGSLFSCVDAALTIAATVTERSPFYAPFDKRDEARAAKASFIWGKSDLLTYVKAFNAWRELRESKAGFLAENDFCSTHFMSRKTLISISNGRRQLADALADAGFGIPGAVEPGRRWERHDTVNQHSANVRIVKAVVCAALYPNVARIDLPDATYHEVAGGTIADRHEARRLKLRAKTGERLFLHPESVNFDQGNYETRWIAYFSKVKTSKLFVRDSTMVSPYAILLFGGEIAVQHKKGQMSVDSWVIFKAPARVAVLARELRRELDGLLMRKFEDADIDLSEEGRAVNDAILRLITLES